MDPYLAWALLGLALVIVELMSGTFYLLVLGIACFGAAGAGLLGQAFPVQVVIAALVAAAGAYLVRGYRARNLARQMAPVDRGQPASFEQWVDRGAGLARVRYRGASWDARFVEPAAAQVANDGAPDMAPGALLYVLATDGNTLKVSKTRPA